MLVFLGISFHPSVSNENLVNLTEIKNVNYSLGTGNNHTITFDFGENAVSNNNTFFGNINYDFEAVPLIHFEGNISLDIISSDISGCYVKFTLPNEDGKTEISFSLEEETIKRSVYSSKSEDNKYAISSLSLYSAWELVGNIPGQKYMDNDVDNASYIGVTPESEDMDTNKPQKISFSGRVYGYLKWEDDELNSHPLIGVKVKLDLGHNQFAYFTYTNSSGYFNINYSSLLASSDCYIHIYAENLMVKVINKNGNVYESANKLTNFSINTNYDFGTLTFTGAQHDDLGYAMQIFSAMERYSEYARTLNNGVYIETCGIVYPTENDGCYYLNNEQNIYLANESYRKNDSPSVHGSWDVIGHEYGHHLQKCFFQQNYSGEHAIVYNGLYQYLFSNIISAKQNSEEYIIDAQELAKAKTHAIGLAWKEAWPTFFAITAQSTFPQDLRKISVVGDVKYSSYNGIDQSLEEMTNTFGFHNQINGESDEVIIESFLYRLWDSNNSIDCDKLSISDTDLWNLMVDNNPEFFYDFINVLYNSELSFSRSDLGKLLEGFKLSSYNISINVSDNYFVLPTFNWKVGGTSIIVDGVKYSFCNNKFTLNFYDLNKNLILKKNNITTNTYTLTQSEWDSILMATGTKYYVMIQSYATLGIESGPYYSSYYEFSKPSMAETNLELDNIRYFEKSLAISQGTEWIFHISFDNSGDKLIQTFGGIDTKMWLYEEDGKTLIANDDDSGYKLNSFINKNLESNKTYVLKIKLYSSTASGKTKLSITPIKGFKNNEDNSLSKYENIYHINSVTNYSLKAYLCQYNSMVLTWTPTESGYYKIKLNSEFDNYLYVINPSSSDLIEYDINENDDSDDSNAEIYGNFNKDITYFIVLSQYDPSETFADYDSGDDINITFTKS